MSKCSNELRKLYKVLGKKIGRYEEVYLKYAEVFDEEYPTEPGGLDEEHQIAEMEECIRRGKPISQDTSRGTVY
ncbi:MAG: hypothetical protein K2J75_02615 [Clostridia bacterium]|nr:hypothetical protein [Clostridia bacterium]